MIKKKEKKEELEQKPPDSSGNGQVMALLNQIAKTQGEQNERLEELEKKGGASAEAQLFVAKMVYDTPRRQLPAYTAISIRMVDPFSLADTCGAILSDRVQKEGVSLAGIRRESVYLHLKSVKALLLNKGADLALQQEVNKPEDFGEPLDVGKGG